MAGMTRRLRERIQRDFPEPGSAQQVSLLVSETSESERVQAAIVLWARGDLARVRDARRLAIEDWRDALVRAELADEDWRERLDAELGPLADLSPLPEELRRAARTFANGEVAWPLADAADVLDALAAAGHLILGVDIRDFDDDGRFVEIAWTDTHTTGRSPADIEAARALAIAGVARATAETWHDPWALVTWTTC
jgi:hypothetical protein